MGKPDAADKREKFERELKARENDPAALLALGKSCFLDKRYDAAIEAYRGSIALDNSATAHYNLGVACQALGKYVEAKKAFLKSLEIDPNHEAAQEALNDLTEY